MDTLEAELSQSKKRQKDLQARSFARSFTRSIATQLWGRESALRAFREQLLQGMLNEVHPPSLCVYPAV